MKEYVLAYGSAASFEVDKSNYKSDRDVLHENWQFVRDAEEDAGGSAALTWEQRVAKRYYDRLFKEYALADLSRYQQGKVALRWRTEKEVFAGKGIIIGIVGKLLVFLVYFDIICCTKVVLMCYFELYYLSREIIICLLNVSPC